MRNRIIYSIVIIPLLVALLRARTHPFFATTQTYEILSAIPLSHSTLIYAVVAITALTILLTTKLYKQFLIPKEGYLLLLVSPPVLTAAIMNPYSLLLAFIGVLSAVLRKHYIATILVVAASFVHPAAFILALALASYQLHKKHKYQALSTIILSAITALLSPAALILQTQFAELQAPGAISIIAVLLAVVGVIQLWDENTNIGLLIILVPLLTGLLILELALISAILAAGLAGYAMRTLRARKWQLETIKTATTYFILLGLLFAVTASTSQAISAQPRAEIIELADFIDELTQEPVTTFSEQQEVFEWYGIQTEYDLDVLASTTTDQLQQQANTYILLEDSYRAPRLRFLLENSNSYVLVEEQGQHQLWRYTY